MCASLITAASLGRLLGGGWGGPAPGPLLGAAAVGAGLPAFLALWRVVLPIRMLAGTLAVALVSLWATSPGSTTYGLPTARTWHALASHLQAAHPILVSFTLPLRPTQGVVLLCALLAGLTSALGSVLLHAQDGTTRLYPALALLPLFGLLAFACGETPTSSVALPVASFVAAAAITLSSAQPAPIRTGTATGRAGRLSPTLALSATIMIGVTLIAFSFGAGSGTIGAMPGGAVPAREPATGLALTSHLVELEVDDANVVLFRAHSPYPTYWQVAVLNVFRDGAWVAAASPPQAATSESTTTTDETFAATVTIDNLSSRLLPAPPATVAVSGVRTEPDTQEAVVAPRRTTTGQQYSTISAVPVNDPSALAGFAPVSTYPQALVQDEVALPALPTSIRAIASQVTAGAHTPLGQAEALVNWFRSGKFRYTLNPPITQNGANPLISFLTQTRAGTCEQFAGAFTVLARSLGLPTRLVVGFTSGKSAGPDQVTVSGRDAHAWPEVYLGPAAGWVSFEPTPQALTGEVAPDGVVGPTGITTVPPPTTVTQPTTTETTTPTTVPPTTTGPTTPTDRQHHVRRPLTTAPVQHSLWWLALAFGGLVAVGLILTALARALRRRSRHARADLAPVAVTARAEASVERALRRAGAARPPWQPLRVFVDLLANQSEDFVEPVELADQLRSLLADAATAAAAAERALYDRDHIDPASAAAAALAADRFRRGARRRDIRRVLATRSVRSIPATSVPSLHDLSRR